MRFEKNSDVEREIEKLRQGTMLNDRIAGGIIAFIEMNEVVLFEAGQMGDRDEMVSQVEDALGAIADSNDVFSGTVERDLALKKMKQKARLLTVQEFSQNPYLRLFHSQEVESGQFRLLYAYYEPGQLFNYDIPAWVAGSYYSVPAVACFDDTFVFPCLVEGDNIWMSISPNEIFTMAEPIDRARGRVLTLGGGMGYYAYMAARKPQVESLVIVEREQSVIDLLETQIIPLFECRDKISVIKGDAYDYLAGIDDGLYDYCFIDTWIGADSVDEYLRAREACARFQQMETGYWIEDSFANLLLMMVSNEVVDSFDGRVSRPEDSPIASAYAGAYACVKKMLEDVVITQASDIVHLVSREGVYGLLESTLR